MMVALALCIAACGRRESPMSTEEIIGEWRKQDNKLPPVNLLLTSEGVGLRARLRLSGRELFGRATVQGYDLHIRFDEDSSGSRGVLNGRFDSKTHLVVHLEPDGTPYHLVKRP